MGIESTLDCPVCSGTGIGQHGDPDTSRCTRCSGTGTYDREARRREEEKRAAIAEERADAAREEARCDLLVRCGQWRAYAKLLLAAIRHSSHSSTMREAIWVRSEIERTGLEELAR